MQKTITLPRTEYKRLQTISQRYEMLQKIFELDFFAEPPTKNASRILQEFRATGLYGAAFLKSLERGLKESSYFLTSRRRSS